MIRTEDTNDDYNFVLEEEVKQGTLLKDHEINGVQRSIRKQDKFPLEETQTRNIIMLGRSGSGKTTAIGVFKDPCSLPRPQSLFSDTVGARFQSFSLDDFDRKVKFSVNIVDTPGVGEVKPMGENARSDEAIIETIKYCLKNEITKIHTLLIFASFGERISPSDKSAFKIYLDMFYDQKVSIAFCITKSEGKSEEWKKTIIDDLSKDEYFSKILKTENIKIFFTGCVDQLRIDEAPTTAALFKRYNEIYNKRRELIKFVFSSNNDGVMLLSLPVVIGTRNAMKDLFKAQGDILTKLENTQDFNTGLINNLVDTFSDNIGYMIENDGMFADQSLYSEFVNMKERMKGILLRMSDKKLATKFSFRVIL